MMKLNLSKFAYTAAIVSVLTLGAGRLAWAGPPSLPTSAAIPSDQIVMTHTGSSQFSSSGLGRTGTFVGTLVQQSCASGQPAGTRAECETDGSYYALAIDGQSGLFTIMPGVQSVRDALRTDAPVGKTVRVSGIAYPATGAILASEIQPSSEAQDEIFSLSTR
jgi:hypothetical protein